MKIQFHLYSSHIDCIHCVHLSRRFEQDDSRILHCPIVGSDVNEDDSCSFYRMKFEKPQDTQTGNAPNLEEEKRKPKKL